jgi:transposase-like protein
MEDRQFWNHKEGKAVKYTVRDFEAQFPDDATCLEWLRTFLYPNGVHCPKCNKITRHHRVASRPSYSCDECGHHVHPTAGTIFHKSSTSLRLWFYAIYLMSSSRCGISAKHLERELGVTYKTAWRMFKQIRTMLNDETPFDGDRPVEIDEMFHGGVRKGNHGRKLTGDRDKVPVLGIVERKGRAVARTIEAARSREVLPLIKKYVMPISTIFTDESKIYDGVGYMQNTCHTHKRINHGEHVYVMGDVHTNSVEGLWSLVKNNIRGAHHAVSAKYLQMYLDEICFRYNRRRDTHQPMFMAFLKQISKTAVEARAIEQAVVA